MTPEIITYHSSNAPPTLTWLAYIVLPNGEYWGVRFNGATEEIARTKAISTWQQEQEKARRLNPRPLEHKLCVKSSETPSGSSQDENSIAIDPWSINEAKQHHRAGKIWMRHKETRELVSIPLTEITMYEKQGFERGGPRSK